MKGVTMAQIDMTKCMRDVVLEDPMFGEFLVDKGFPFSVENPITELVTFADVVKLRHLDKDAFLAEYDEYRARGGVLPDQDEPSSNDNL
jgi:hypothetical protein